MDAFLAAARKGDFDALVAVLDPHVVLRADAGAALSGLSHEVRGAEAVASQALTFRRLDLTMRHVRINGAPGIVTTLDGKPFSIIGYTVREGKIAEMNILADPERLQDLGLSALAD